MTHTAKHTPGPWYPHYAKADHCLSSSVWGQEPGNQVAVIGGKSLEAMNANARLIAAAPVMYEALSRLRNVASTASNHMRLSGNEEEALLFDNDQRVVEAALAQAEGAQHE